MKLMIQLQEGFKDDRVVIRLNGQEIYHKEAVSTDLRLGYSDSINAEVNKASTHLDIELPSRRVSDSTSIDMQGDTYLGIFVDDKTIGYRLSNEPFSYF